MCKRRHQRVEVQDMVTHISNGVDSFSGTVINISRLGMLLEDIPQKFVNQGEEFSIVVSAGGNTFKMQVEPRWVRENEFEQKVGVAILGPPLGWTLFAMICEPKDEDFCAPANRLPGF